MSKDNKEKNDKKNKLHYDPVVPTTGVLVVGNWFTAASINELRISLEGKGKLKALKKPESISIASCFLSALILPAPNCSAFKTATSAHSDIYARRCTRILTTSH